MKADVRISIKDYRKNKNLKVLLRRLPYNDNRFWITMNGDPWPASGAPVSITRLMTALRKALVKRL